MRLLKRFVYGFIITVLLMFCIALLVYGGEITEDVFWEHQKQKTWYEMVAMYVSWAEALIMLTLFSWKLGDRPPWRTIYEFFFKNNKSED